jgi:uncharacterized membrane protein
MARLAFLDAVRGLAIVLMVVNHTARWWLAPSPGPAGDALVYGTVLLPAAMFLFLVGFGLVLSAARRPDTGGLVPRAVPYLRRGLGIVLAGIVLNVLVFRDEPFWTSRVLQTIGLSVALLGVATPLLRSRAGRAIAAVVALALYAAFAAFHAPLDAWLAERPVTARALFFDFPPWPWLAVPLAGVAAGWTWLEARRRGPREESAFFRRAAIAGALGLALYAALTWWLDPRPRFAFERDIVVNWHWTPGGTTALLVGGGTASILALAYRVVEVGRVRLRPLVVLGRAALMLYLVHHLIVLTLVSETLGWRAADWPRYWAANAALMALLVAFAYAWLGARRRVAAIR